MTSQFRAARFGQIGMVATRGDGYIRERERESAMTAVAVAPRVANLRQMKFGMELRSRRRRVGNREGDTPSPAD